jgi:DNA-binding NarL/FixJ family response regulator
MSAVELSIGLVEQQADIERRSPDRPFSKLLPVDSVVQRITAVPGEFTRVQQIAVLRACGFPRPEIADMLGIRVNTIYNHYRHGAVSERSVVGITVALVKEGKIDPVLLTKHLNPDAELSDREREVLSAISEEEMWEAEDSRVADGLGIAVPTIRTHLQEIYRKLKVEDRTQATIYGLFVTKKAITTTQRRIREEIVIVQTPELLKEVNVLGQFTKSEYIAILRARGITSEKIGVLLGGISSEAIDQYMHKRVTGFGLTTTGIVVSLVETGRLSVGELTKGLHLGNNELTELQAEALDLISRKDRWGATDKELAAELDISESIFKGRLASAFHKLGVRSRSQAVIFGLNMPLSLEGQSKLVEERRLKVVTLRAQGFKEAEIADKLHLSETIIGNDISWAKSGYLSQVDAVISRLEDGTIEQAAVIDGLEPECDGYDSLSPNEQKILKDLLVSRDVEGNKGISKRLRMPEQSVKNNMSSIFEKLGVRNRIQAAVFEYLRVKSEEENSAIPRRQIVI